MPAGFEQGEAIETERCSGTTEVTCELGGVAPAGEPTLVAIPVRVSPAAEPAAGEAAPVDLVSVSGGGAPGEAKSRVPVVVGAGTAGFGFSNVDGWITNANGAVDTQAGSHPYSLSVAFSANSVGAGNGREDPAVGETHSLNVNLPPGLVGQPGVVPKRTRSKFDGERL